LGKQLKGEIPELVELCTTCRFLSFIAGYVELPASLLLPAQKTE